MAEFAVIGLGRFGRAVARSLSQDGQAVLAIDKDPDRLQLVANTVEAIAVIDATSEEAVTELRLARMAGVVVAMGPRATEASILTTAILKQHGVERIVARAFDEAHARVLLAIGASEIVNPEDEVGSRLAGHLSRPGIVSRMELGEEWLALVEAPQSLAGKSIADALAAAASDLRPVALLRASRLDVEPEPGLVLEPGDRLLLAGSRTSLRRLSELK